jgi:hypothetical protein
MRWLKFRFFIIVFTLHFAGHREGGNHRALERALSWKNTS